MYAFIFPSLSQSPKFKKEHFGLALMIGAIIETLIIEKLSYSHLPQPMALKQKPKIIAIHMIQPAPPKPKSVPPPSKFVVHPKPILIPIPRPISHLVVHHLPHKPLLAKTPVPRTPVYTSLVIPPAPLPPTPKPEARQAIDFYASEVRSLIQVNLWIPEELGLKHLSG